MDSFIIVLIGFTALAVVYVLVRGILTMASGKDVTGQRSNQLMTARVMLQGAAVLLVVLLFVLFGRGAGG
ncbi:MAG: HIG1 domain-containing protein [Sphingomonadaceae bacterium]